MEKKNNFKKYLKILKKKVKLRYLIILIVLLACNSYAWFIYSTQIQSDLTIHVRAWKILFESAESPISETVDIDVDSIYPGMSDYIKDITAYNKSDVSADLSYTILSARVMNDSYVSQEGMIENNQTPTGTEYTSAQLIDKLVNDYPFKITISISSSPIEPGIGKASYIIKVTWAYESGNDTTDTYWGNLAYDYKAANPDTPCIALKIKVSITQVGS